MQKPLLICVVGPTAIGKTTLGIQIAKAFSTEIISADSRQFYKEMTIGTAVPSAEELAVVTHHFIQHTSIFEKYTVGDFEREAINKLRELFKTRNMAVLVGGSGLYIDAVAKGLDKFPEIDPKVREELNAALENNGIEYLQKELEKADPTTFKNIDIKNPRRIIRALEIFRSSGKPYSSFITSQTTQREFTTLYIGLKAERPLVYDRINQRVDTMLAEGLLEEAERLFPHKDLNSLQTVGYKELFNYFEDAISKDEAIEEIKKNTRRFAKRQVTWFRKNEAIQWFDYNSPIENILNYIQKKTL
ncbi:MAG: tRNA dimethylallyltransferase [Patiriisocius sp.]|jgi:tRNA dimethylallyltransferase